MLRLLLSSPRSRVPRWLACLGALLANSSCSDLDDRLDTYRDRIGEGGAPPTTDEWDCLDDTPPAAPAMPLPGVAYVVPVVDFANPPTPIPGLKIKVCQTGDRDCAIPVKSSVTQPDPMRPFLYRVDLPYGFDGYLDLSAENYIGTEYYFGGIVVGGQDGQASITGEAIPPPTLVTADNLVKDLARSVRDPDKGILAVRTIDCNGKRAAGVTVRLKENLDDALAYTLIRNLPVFAVPPRPTDSRGVAGFVNVRDGTVEVEGVLPDGRTYGSVPVRARANKLTVVEVRPPNLLPR